jgi:hypothetical protein
MKAKEILNQLWDIYITDNPSVKRVHDCFIEAGEKVMNDHIAFRTFNHPKINIEVLSVPFIQSGYIEKGTYEFEKKKLTAKHYEHATDKSLPLVFISQLKTEEFSPFVNNLVEEIVDKIPLDLLHSDSLIFSGLAWGKPNYSVYKRLTDESEYAAWLYMSGFRANHFTVRVNHLQEMNSIEQVNSYLKQHGFSINSSGGEIKGSPEEYLEQSSIVSEDIFIEFEEGLKQVPGCFYEFAKRYPLPDGSLFMGFIANSADKIFESTNSKR